MIQVQGNNHSWVVFTISSATPISDEDLEANVAEIKTRPVKLYVIEGLLDYETTFDNIDNNLTMLRGLGFLPGQIGITLPIGEALVVLIPADDINHETIAELQAKETQDNVE